MVFSYLPILKAKSGEFRALANSRSERVDRMLPLFEVGRIGEAVRKKKRYQDEPHLVCAYLDDVAKQIADAWSGRSALADAFQWLPNSYTETGEHILPYLYTRLQEFGVHVVPVIGYDRWDSPSYRMAMQGIQIEDDEYYCLRLDSHAMDDADDPDYFRERIVDMLDGLGATPEKCAVLLDFGDVTTVSVERLIEQSVAILDILVPLQFRFYSTAGCSLPPSIDAAVDQPDSTGRVVRREMLLWQALVVAYPTARWLFGDYGIRGPNTADDVIAPHANGKIRHTISREYFVARGHSMQKLDKGRQMHKLAATIVNSSHYLGEEFSWGDEQIMACSKEVFPGNSTTWIAIDTNHHVALVTAEIAEYVSKVGASTSRV